MIILNAREMAISNRTLSYREIIELTGKPFGVYTVTYSKGRNNHGELTDGQIVDVSENMLINVGMTNNA